VLELNDLEDRAIDLDVVAVFELVCGDQVESVLLEPKIHVVCALGRRQPDVATDGWLNEAPAEHHRRIVRRTWIAALLCVALACAGCGKDGIAVVKRPVLPLYLCWRTFKPHPSRPCQHRFDAGQLVSLRLDAASSLAAAHGYSVRRIAPLARGESLTADLQLHRIDVECAEASEDCIVVRIVEQG
jgi:hypothetical protein